MKKFYINIRNSKKGKIIDLLPLVAVALEILFFFAILLISPWYLWIPCAFLTGMLSYLLVPYTVYALSNCIYVDEEKDEILLKAFAARIKSSSFHLLRVWKPLKIMMNLSAE